MFASRFQKNRIARFALNRVKDALIMVTVGVVGSNLLLVSTGGFPLTKTAQAATNMYMLSAIQVSNLNFDLDPTNPAMVSQIQFSADLPDGSKPSSLAIRFENSDQISFSCRNHDGGNIWACDVRSVEVADLNQFFVLVN